MTQTKLEKYLLSLPKTNKSFPFGEDVAVFKVCNKMFALFGIKDKQINLNLKGLPEDNLAYREIYKCVIAGYHMNKKHWNTVIICDEIPDERIKDMIDESYTLICSKLTKKETHSLKEV